MVSPPADIEVDEHLVRSLLAEQHPDLAGLALVQLDAGWDNTLWRLGGELLVRLPRRAVAADLTAHEQRWLPELGGRLPLPVPVAVRVGRPTDGYPWPWSVVRWIDGTPADRAPAMDAIVVAEQLGTFLRALHRTAPASAPGNPFRGVPLVARADSLEERVSDLVSVIDGPALRAEWDRSLAAPAWRDAPVWLHGDLHPANVLVADRRLAAVIDFGDVCAGDPATDLAAAWMVLPNAARPAFLDAYGGVVDDGLLARSRGWALLFGLMLLAIGLDDRPSYADVGRRTLARVLDETNPGL